MSRIAVFEATAVVGVCALLCGCRAAAAPNAPAAAARATASASPSAIATATPTAPATGAATATPGATASGRAIAAAPIAASADRWSTLSWEDRHDQMTWVVHPTMARLFQRFEQTEAPELTCRTCHGRDAEQVQYKMPHGLPALDPAHMPDPTGSGPVARIARFMADEVTPRMADLLGVPAYDPRTGQGFGCFGCHPARPSSGSM